MLSFKNGTDDNGDGDAADTKETEDQEPDSDLMRVIYPKHVVSALERLEFKNLLDEKDINGETDAKEESMPTSSSSTSTLTTSTTATRKKRRVGGGRKKKVKLDAAATEALLKEQEALFAASAAKLEFERG